MYLSQLASGMDTGFSVIMDNLVKMFLYVVTYEWVDFGGVLRTDFTIADLCLTFWFQLFLSHNGILYKL